MRRLLILFAMCSAAAISGCAIFGTAESNITPPTLIEKVALPTPPTGNTDLFLKTELLIGKDGSVRQVRLLVSSGDPKWDSSAVETIKLWKYSPPLVNNVPVQMKIIQIAHVVATPSIMMHLAQLLFTSESQADSVSKILKSGGNFDSLAALPFLPNSVLHNGDLGEVDIHLFTGDIQSELTNLKPGEITRILPLGPYYAIFKRVE